MSKEAHQKIQEGLQKGTRVELGPNEVLDFSSDVIDALSPLTGMFSKGTQRLIVGPSATAIKRKLHLKLTFALDAEREEYPFVEFEVIRSGQDELEIQSCSKHLPLVLAITFNIKRNEGGFRASCCYVGHEIRSIFKANRALNMFSGGGSLEVFDLGTDAPFPTLTAGHLDSPTAEADARESNLIIALHEIALALNTRINWPQQITREDAAHLQLLEEIIHTGQAVVHGDSISFAVDPGKPIDLDAISRQPGNLLVTEIEPPPFASIFGKTLDLGEHTILIKPRRVAISYGGGEEAAPVLQIDLAEPLVYHFPRFAKDA
jgi:hypothetical protein